MTKVRAVHNEELHGSESLALMERSYRGLLANLELVEKEMKPVKEYLDGRSQPPSFFGEFVGNGWPSMEMLSYFYRDWNGTKEAETIASLFIDTIERFCHDRDSVAVLGSGAGKLTYRAAEFFRQTFGVELAIDTLLLSKKLLDGGHITLHYSIPKTNFPLALKVVRIDGVAERPAGISLLNADVHQLPFRSSSLSCVITHYVMDIIQNQRKVASEIHRVLKPGGVWVDLSLPISTSAADQFNTLDWPLFLKRFGFKLLDLSVSRFNFLDLSALSEWAWTQTQAGFKFVAEKVPGSALTKPNYFAEYFAGTGDAVWEKVPKRTVDMALVHERRFTAEGIQKSKGLLVEHLNNQRPLKFAVSDQTAALTEWFLQTIDGVRTIREIFELMRQAYGEFIQPDDVLKFFNDLEVSSFIEIN
jgi:SAM-dependent methyltransferase